MAIYNIYFWNKDWLHSSSVWFINYLFNFSSSNFSCKIWLYYTKIEYLFDPTKGDNFQTDKALAAIKQGGLTGQGMGEGILKESVPEAHTDYIIAVIAEEFGSVISIIVITIFLYISYKIIKNCFKTSDEKSKIALCGLSSLLIFQTFIHIGVNTSLLPTTGMTLPFFELRRIFFNW